MRLRTGRARLSLYGIAVLCVVSLLTITPAVVSGQEGGLKGLTNKLKQLMAPAQDKGQFTIEKVDPNGDDKSITITFSDSVDFYTIRGNLKFVPPVPIRWHDSSAMGPKSVRIYGGFAYGRQYTMILPAELRSSSGRPYTKTTTSFTMPDLRSQITFLESGTVIERDSRQMLHIQIVNVNEVAFRGLRIPPALAAVALEKTGSTHRSWTGLGTELSRAAEQITQVMRQDFEFMPFVGAVTEDRQLFFSQKERNLYHQFSIPVSFRQDKEKGAIELVQVTSSRKDQAAESELRLVRVTDIGLTYKLSRDGLLIWATSLRTGKPLPNVAMLGLTTGREAVALGSTDSRGTVSITNAMQKKHAPLSGGAIVSRPVSLDSLKLVAAAGPNDQTFVLISSEGNVHPEGISQTKEPPAGTRMLRGHVFTERGIYRPGDRVHFKGTVREYRDGKVAAPGSGSPTFLIVNSKGEEVFRKELKLSDFGTANDTFATKAFFPVGTYTITMRYGAASADVATRTFEVQEFRQPRHFVEVIYKRESTRDESFVNVDVRKETLNCEISGVYYAGGPVKHGRVRWNIYHTRTDYTRPDLPGYGFGYPLEARSELIESGESMLDEKGRITVPVPLSRDVISGKYGIEVLASVVDFDGRAASESAVYQGDPEYLIGISTHPVSVQPNEPQSLTAVVIDKKGRKVSKGSVTVQVMQEGWTYIQKRNEQGHLYGDRQKVWRKRLSTELAIRDGFALFDFDFSMGGNYLVSFTYQGDDGRDYTSGTEYRLPGGYYYFEYDTGQQDVQKAYERLNLYPEKASYQPNETIRIMVNPHRAVSHYLITVEQANLVEYLIMEVKPGQRAIELPVKNAYSPNVYISVLGTVPRTSHAVYASQFDTDAPGFLFGTVNIEVKGEQERIKLSVNEEQKKLKALPGAEMTLTVLATDQANKGMESEIALAVVDESILAMTGFQTPSLDSLGRFLLPLGVFTGENRIDLLRQTPFGFFKNAPLTGGDGEEAGPEAVTSKIRKDFNPVAYFNPALRTDGSGKATVTFKVPDTMTTYRVYAVACDKGARFGSYQRSALVVKDFYLEPGLPAFLTRGDRFRFLVSAFNKTDRSAQAQFSVSSDSLVSLTSLKGAHPVGPYDRTLIPVDGNAAGAGTSTIQFSGNFKDDSDAVELKVPVNSGHVLGTDVVFGNFKRQTAVKYTMPKAVQDLAWEDTGPGEVKAELMVSGSPYLRMTAGLQYLLRYPYGCVEQTSSGVLPLAALKESITKGLIPGISGAETDKFIRPGIDRLFSMQTSSGGFGYWPGDRTPHYWGSIYALTALTRSRLAGYDLPKDRMDKALAYLQDEVKASGRHDATFRGFAVYILAQNNKLDRETFNKAAEGLDTQPREAAMLVLMSAKLSKLMPDDEIKTRMRPLLDRPWLLDRFSGEFYARYREPAISLLAANAAFRGEEIADRMASRLIGGMSPEGIWTSTSDTGWSLVALSDYFTTGSGDGRPATVTVKQGGRVVESFTFDPKSFKTVDLDAREFLRSPGVAISSTGDQTILYRLSLTFPRTDYSKNGYSNGFEVHKTIRNTDGSNTIRVGDIVEVKLRINVKHAGANYVVVDDPLPAGFVAINSAIKTEEHNIAKTAKKRASESEGEEDEENGEEDASEGEFGEGVEWSEWYWDPAGYYRFTPNFFEIRTDRVLAFRNRAWTGLYEYSYYARAICEGEFVMPSTKAQLMYSPEIVGYSPTGKVVIKGK